MSSDTDTTVHSIASHRHAGIFPAAVEIPLMSGNTTLALSNSQFSSVFNGQSVTTVDNRQ